MGQFVAWLKQILRNNIRETVEVHQLAKRRSINRERSLEELGSFGGCLRDCLEVEQSTPSQRIRREERAKSLIKAIESLSGDQQETARLRFLDGLPIVQIAERLQKSKSAVAGLLKRGMQKLRQELNENHELRIF